MKNKLIDDRKDFLFELPVEVCFQILNFISAKDLLSCSQVSKRWNKLCDDELIWFKKCREIKVPEICHFQTPPFNDGSLKLHYLNYSRLISNWHDGSHINPLLVPVHRDHIITGLVLFGQWMASCSDDGSVVVLDLLSGKKLQSFCGHSGGVWSLVALSVNGQPFLATSSTDCTVRLWHLLTGQCIHVLRGHANTVRCLATSEIANGETHTKIISGSRDTTIRIWNVITGQCIHLLSGHIGAVRCVRADDRRVVSGSYDHSVRVWDLKSGECMFVLIGHTNRVYTLYMGRQVLLSASLDTTLRVWSTDSKNCIHVLEGHRSLTCDIAMNSDESLIVSGNADNSIRIWLLSTGQCIFKLDGESKHLSALTSVQVVLDRFIVSSGTDGTVKLWNLNDGTFIRDVVRLEYACKGAVVWRSLSTNNHLVCAVGSRNGFEETKLIIFDFSSKMQPLSCRSYPIL